MLSNPAFQTNSFLANLLFFTSWKQEGILSFLVFSEVIRWEITQKCVIKPCSNHGASISANRCDQMRYGSWSVLQFISTIFFFFIDFFYFIVIFYDNLVDSMIYFYNFKSRDIEENRKFSSSFYLFEISKKTFLFFFKKKHQRWSR